LLRSIAHGAGCTIAGLFVLIASACEKSSRPDSAWLGSVDTLPNGAERVQNPETGMWPEGRGWRIAQEVRLGTALGDGPDVFGEVAAIGVSPTGLIHVIDGHSQEIRVFTPAGEHVRSFGRRGGGPGEFANAYSLDWDRVGVSVRSSQGRGVGARGSWPPRLPRRLW